MPKPITWDPLAKSIDDNTTIDEEIDATLLAHNLDPSAHSQSSEAIFAHKNAPVLDHVTGSIYNEHVNNASKTYDAIVDAAGNADFEDIQDAIDYIATLGGGTIFVRSGSYNVSAGLTLYSHIKLIGEDNNDTILHGVGDDLWVLIQGTEEEPIEDVYIRNLRFTDMYIDDPLILMGWASDIHIENNVFTFPDDPGYFPNWCIGTSADIEKIHIIGNRFENVHGSIYLPGAFAVWISENYFVDYTDACIVTYSIYDALIYNNFFDHSKNNAMTDANIFAEDSAGNLRIIGNMSNNVSSHLCSLGNLIGGIISNNQILGGNVYGSGIALGASSYCVISNNYIYNAKDDGILLYDDSNRNSIVGNVCYTNHGYGINISAASCDKNLVVGNVCYNNTLGNTHDAGTGSVFANNVTT